VAYLDNILLRNEEQQMNATDGEDLTDGITEKPLSEDEGSELLEELQFIVEQIDYAKSFAVMGGIEFLIGCAAQKEKVSDRIRSGCLSVLSTLCQNNPSVQYMMLEHGAIVKLLTLYGAECSHRNTEKNTEDGQGDIKSKSNRKDLRAKVMQVMSSMIRNHDTAENIFCMNADGVKMIESGLGMHNKNETLPVSNAALKQKTLFFLQALVTSDSAEVNRVRMFTPAVQYAACNFLDPDKECSQEIREVSLSMLVRILDRKRSANTALDLKPTLVALAVKRIPALRGLEGEEKEYAAEELRLWESLITNIARTPRDEEKVE